MKLTPRIEFSSTGFGQFAATNGADCISAVYVRGSRSKGEQPHWDLTGPGIEETVTGPKEQAVERVTDLLTQPLAGPLSREQAVEIQRRDGTVHGIVEMSVDELAAAGNQAVLQEILNRRLTDARLDTMACQIVAAADWFVYIRVGGRMESEDV